MRDSKKVRLLSVPSLSSVLVTSVTALFVGSLAVLIACVIWVGWRFYLFGNEASEGVDVALVLEPSGPIGVGLGFIGTALMLAMLLYTLRKMMPRAHYLGPISGWLRFHIICGVAGPILIVLHGGFAAPTGIVAIAYWCMILVALSGVFGRYLFGHFPKNEAGLQLDLDLARAELTALRAQLVAETKEANTDSIGRAVAIARDFDVEVSSLFGLVRLGREARRRKREIRKALATNDIPVEIRKGAVETLVGQISMKQSLEAWSVSRQLFRYWHLFHLPLAQAMYLIVAFHIVVSLLFGGAFFELAALPDLFL